MARQGSLYALTLALVANLAGGCATNKESFTPRTGVEQLLLSSAIEQSLDKVDLSPVRRKKVFLETKFLECVDKNYIIVSLHRRLLTHGARLVDKADDADTIVEVASGGVGTDGQELFVGIPEIPLPPPSPISIPKLSLMTRTKMNGTAKLLVVAYEAKSRQPIILQDSALARSDHNNWSFIGAGPLQTGSVPREIAQSSKEFDFTLNSVAYVLMPGNDTPPPPNEVVPATHTRP